MEWEIIFWAVLAALSFVGELFTITFFLLFFALGSVVALLVALVGLGLVPQTIAFVAASVLSMVVLRPALLNRLALRGGDRYVSGNDIAGRKGVVTSVIEADGKGTVRIGSGEFWTARSLRSDQELKEGTKVRVLDRDGLTALVESLEIEEGEEL